MLRSITYIHTYIDYKQLLQILYTSERNWMLPKPNMLPQAAGTNERLQKLKSQELRKKRTRKAKAKKPPDGKELGKHRMRTAEAKETPKAKTKKNTYQLGMQRMGCQAKKPKSQEAKPRQMSSGSQTGPNLHNKDRDSGQTPFRI